MEIGDAGGCAVEGVLDGGGKGSGVADSLVSGSEGVLVAPCVGRGRIKFVFTGVGVAVGAGEAELMAAGEAEGSAMVF